MPGCDCQNFVQSTYTLSWLRALTLHKAHHLKPDQTSAHPQHWVPPFSRRKCTGGACSTSRPPPRCTAC